MGGPPRPAALKYARSGWSVACCVGGAPQTVACFWATVAAKFPDALAIRCGQPIVLPARVYGRSELEESCVRNGQICGRVPARDRPGLYEIRLRSRRRPANRMWTESRCGAARFTGGPRRTVARQRAKSGLEITGYVDSSSPTAVSIWAKSGRRVAGCVGGLSQIWHRQDLATNAPDLRASSHGRPLWNCQVPDTGTPNIRPEPRKQPPRNRQDPATKLPSLQAGPRKR